MKKFLLLLAFALSAGAALAQQSPQSASDLNGDGKPEKGWFFFEDPPKPVEEEPAPPPKAEFPSKLPPPPKEKKCVDKASWSPECGFVDPGTDFEFQAKQRDALMERMSVQRNDPKAVEAFQYYMRWVLERTAETTNLWWYNMVQNPDLDPNVRAPVSAFGLRLMTDVQRGHEKEIFDLVKAEGGFFVYFSRSDCVFCHQMKDVLSALSRRTGLVVRNASLDTTCMPGFEEGCMKAPETEAPARSLQVSTVPTVFLYVQPNTWIRVATGVVDAESMVTRTAQFFSAYRSALLSGVENGQGGRPSVNFSDVDPSGVGKGVDLQGTDKEVKLPDEGEIARMLGAKP